MPGGLGGDTGGNPASAVDESTKNMYPVLKVSHSFCFQVGKPTTLLPFSSCLVCLWFSTLAFVPLCGPQAIADVLAQSQSGMLKCCLKFPRFIRYRRFGRCALWGVS